MNLNIYSYSKLIYFLKQQGLYNEKFFEFMEGKIKIKSGLDISWYGVWAKVDEETKMLYDIRMLVPEIKDKEDLLINIHEYVHALELFDEIGTIYEEDEECIQKRESRAKKMEKIYLKSIDEGY